LAEVGFRARESTRDFGEIPYGLDGGFVHDALPRGEQDVAVGLQPAFRDGFPAFGEVDVRFCHGYRRSDLLIMTGIGGS